jgi:hypothetical protein
VSSFQEGDDRYEVRLRVTAEDRRSAETVGRLLYIHQPGAVTCNSAAW